MNLPPLNFNLRDVGGGKSDATGGTSSNPFEIPFNFDSSGWNVNIGGSGDQSAKGGSGASTGGSKTDARAGGISAASGLGSTGFNFNYLLVAAAVWLFMRR